ncbi:isocitrate lyase [bacterium]|nr:isocitrate lyase [bacterium]NBX71445.1 isocitrate lyase [bacterium]
MSKNEQENILHADWCNNPRWKGIKRPYTAKEVVRLRPSLQIKHTIAEYGAEKLWGMLHQNKPVISLGCMTGNQAIECVQAGVDAIYCSGWQVAGDNNAGGEMYPDQSLYSVDSVPRLVKQINNAFERSDQIYNLDDKHDIDWYAPIIADAEAGFGGNLNAFELMKHLIQAGASAVHLEDQLSSAKKCGHMGGKVLIPVYEGIQKLVSARLAADVCGVPTLIIARTDANGAKLVTSDFDERDRQFMTGERSAEGFYYVKSGIESAISRGLAFAPYADLLWCETSTPNIEEAREFAQAIHSQFPGKLLAYNCSPSFNWKKKLKEEDIKTFREQLFEMGYVYQFITLAGWHALNLSMFELARQYKVEGMYAYSCLQEKEIALEEVGFRAYKHQSFVGAGYFDAVQTTIMQGNSSLTALKGSTEDQF